MTFSAPLRSTYRLALYVGWVFTCLVVQGIARIFKQGLEKRFPQIAHRVCAELIGTQIVIKGEQVKSGGVLFVSNHCSYADIAVLGSLIRGAFVAKAEVKSWPVFGWCAQLSNTIFVDRRPRMVKSQTKMLYDRLSGGDSLILFPEGTSSDGNRVLPFRSSLFAAAEPEAGAKTVTVQPVSITYTHLDGIPLGRHLRPFVAWYGDMELLPHLWRLVGLGRPRAVVEFHQPVDFNQFGSRKEIAAYCEAIVATGVSSALSGREQPLSLPGRGDQDMKLAAQ